VVQRRIDAVVFDYGGVLTSPLRVSTGQWLAGDQVDPESFRQAMREWLGRDAVAGTPVHRLETGELSGADFEVALAERLVRLDGRPVAAEGLLGRLFAGMRPDTAMIELMADLRATGLLVGVLSNSWGNTYPDELDRWCDAVVISGEVGLCKPDPRIYALMLDKLSVPAPRAAFVDDAPVNVAAANELGMHGIRHTDAATTRAALTDLIPDLPAAGSVGSAGEKDVTP
jgi:epoxide hydrolase-like predicted phosphatase